MPRLIKTIALVVVVALLVTLPGLVGCAKEKGSEREVVIGVLQDFTGIVSWGLKAWIGACLDYFKMVEDIETMSW